MRAESRHLAACVPDALEDNDPPQHATPLVSGQALRATSCPGDVYAIDVPQGSTIEVDLERDLEGPAARVELPVGDVYSTERRISVPWVGGTAHVYVDPPVEGGSYSLRVTVDHARTQPPPRPRSTLESGSAAPHASETMSSNSRCKRGSASSSRGDCPQSTLGISCAEETLIRADGTAVLTMRSRLFPDYAFRVMVGDACDDDPYEPNQRMLTAAPTTSPRPPPS